MMHKFEPISQRGVFPEIDYGSVLGVVRHNYVRFKVYKLESITGHMGLCYS